MSIISFLVRSVFSINDTKRDAGLTAPDSVSRFDNISYGPDRKWQVLDVYRPADAGGVLPVIISVHGGGWVYGDKERYQYYCMSLAEHGFAVVNYTYRLAPEHKFPAPLEDADLVFKWVHEHSEEYGFDIGNIFAVGDSAGATILSLYCCICTNPVYAKEYDISASQDLCPKAVALNCGLYNQKKSRKKDLGQLLMANLMPDRGTDREYELIQVGRHVTEAFPPAFIMTAEGDFLADQAQPFYDWLVSLGVHAEYHYYGGPDHILGHVFHCNIRLDDAKRCNSDECSFFRKKM